MKEELLVLRLENLKHDISTNINHLKKNKAFCYETIQKCIQGGVQSLENHCYGKIEAYDSVLTMFECQEKEIDSLIAYLKYRK